MARAEGLTLQRSESASGYKGVRIDRRGDMRCRYEARLKRGGKDMYIGHVSWHVTQTRTLCVHTTILSSSQLTSCSPFALSSVCHRRRGGPGLREGARSANGAGQLLRQGEAAH